MDLKSGYPFWAIRNGLMHAYPPLAQALRCDVLVVGGGITGALIADELARHGHDVVAVEPTRELREAGHALQDLVAALVSEGVVDVLEPVQIEIEEGERSSLVDGSGKTSLEAPTVRQLGEHVVLGKLGDLSCNNRKSTACLTCSCSLY